MRDYHGPNPELVALIAQAKKSGEGENGGSPVIVHGGVNVVSHGTVQIFVLPLPGSFGAADSEAEKAAARWIDYIFSRTKSDPEDNP
ncbi:MAG: hypothetical protein QJR02_07325 [Sinobacteraceae bacterium]|nr:hypothetical protein [Nevskiaceae bacterium]